jgi:DNA-binding XRE family transcriptional regulator
MAQAKLGETVGVTQASIAGIEKGKREPSVKLLRKLADALAVDSESYVLREPDVSKHCLLTLPQECDLCPSQ